jgi:hypothetical protein
VGGRLTSSLSILPAQGDVGWRLARELAVVEGKDQLLPLLLHMLGLTCSPPLLARVSALPSASSILCVFSTDDEQFLRFPLKDGELMFNRYM